MVVRTEHTYKKNKLIFFQLCPKLKAHVFIFCPFALTRLKALLRAVMGFKDLRSVIYIILLYLLYQTLFCLFICLMLLLPFYLFQKIYLLTSSIFYSTHLPLHVVILKLYFTFFILCILLGVVLSLFYSYSFFII